MNPAETNCPLCTDPGGIVLWQSPDCRVVRVDDAHYPGFCRVIWNAHIREMSDLPPDARRTLMKTVFTVETVICDLFTPDKINLASLGNQVPHLHWHIIPRWRDDRHFPEPIWSQVHNEHAPARRQVSDDALRQALQQALGTLPEVAQ